MTKEELRKEATATIGWECTPMIDRPTFINGYITGAESREKHIAELEKACNETQELLDKQIEVTYKLIEENTELKELHESDKKSLTLIAKKGEELEKVLSNSLSCKNCSENKGGLICQKEYEDKCLVQKIQYIKELQEENAELKELLKNIIRVTWGEGWNYSLDWKVKAEQFIKDE